MKFRLRNIAIGSFNPGIGEDRVLALSRLASTSNIILHTINRGIRGKRMLKTVCGKAFGILKPYRRLNSNYCLRGLVSFKAGRLGIGVKSILSVGSLTFKVG